jgi:MoaA/NifB/PqqE/SkfB family radical SAM enzyme
MNKQILETLRLQLNETEKEFAKSIDLSFDDYQFFKNSNCYDMFPMQSLIKLKQIMIDEEHNNIVQFHKDYKVPENEQNVFGANKIFCHLDKLAGIAGDKESKINTGPVSVEIHPSTYCNHACPGCVYGTPKLSKNLKHNFDYDLFDKLLKDLKDLKVRGINFSGGGEPLIHKNIEDMIKKTAKDFEVGLITNGELFDESKIDTVIDNCLWCRISLDAGSQEVYSQMHGENADFDNIIKIIKQFAARKIEKKSNITFGVSYLLTTTNFLDVVSAICILKNIPGVDYIQIKPIVLFPQDRFDMNMIFWDKRIFEVLSIINSYATDTFKIYALDSKFFSMMLKEKTGLEFKKCYGHPFFPTVTSDGHIVVCCFKLNNIQNGIDEGIYGQITKDRSFKDIWTTYERFNIGDCLNIRNCPINCKIEQTNTNLSYIFSKKMTHSNFIN